MKRKITAILTVITMIVAVAAPFSGVSADEVWMPNPIRTAEQLDRGLVVMQTSNGIYLTWRLQADEDNVYGTGKDNVSFDIYRDGAKIATESNTTNYLDTEGTAASKYQVVVKDGEVTGCKEVSAFDSGSNYFDIAVNKPEATKLPRTATFTKSNGNSYIGFADKDGNEVSGWDNENAVWDEAEYTLGDASCGDLDGDGEYEIVVKWDCGGKDNSQTGLTGTVFLDAYKLDGTRLWRIDLGRNIRSGAHYTQFLVYDFDGDGKAEITCKTAPGSKDSKGEYVSSVSADSTIKSTDNNASYINSNGYILDGPEFFTVFNGQTGAAVDTIYYPNQRIDASVWGDTNGNRCDRFTAAVAYLDGTTPYAVYMRGYYFGRNGNQRQAACAISFDGEKLDCKYSFDTYNPSSYSSKSSSPSYSSSGAYLGVDGYISGNEKYVGQGNHNCTVADVDNDGRDEVMTGPLCYELKDEILTPLWCTYKQHGDALHIGDYDPTHSGYEFFVVHEDSGTNSLSGTDVTMDYGVSVIDPATGEIMFHKGASDDTGRGMMADVGAGGYYQINAGRYVATHIAKGNNEFEESSFSFSNNFRIFWDGDTYDELLDGTSIAAWNKNISSMQTIFTADGCVSVNGSKANPSLQADLFGDWREEVVYPLSDSSALRVFTSNIYTRDKMKSLMYDGVYRCGVAAEQTAYNQPPHIGYYIEHQTLNTDILYEKGTSAETAWAETDLSDWTQKGTATFKYANDDEKVANGYISCSQTNPSASYSLSKSFNLKENAVVTYNIVWRYGSVVNKNITNMGGDTNYTYLQLGDNVRLAWFGAPSYYRLYYSTDGGATYTDTGFTRANNTYYSNVVAVFDTSSSMITLSVEKQSILSNVKTDVPDSIAFGFLKGNASLYSSSTAPLTALTSIKVTQEYEGEAPVLTPTPTPKNFWTFNEDMAVVEASGISTWDSGSLAGWFLNRDDTNGSVQVKDGMLQVYVTTSNNKTYLGLHADTVANVKDKLVTFGFDYKSNSGENTDNNASEIALLSYDDNDVTYHQISDNNLGISQQIVNWGMTDTSATYAVTIEIDNSKNTAVLTAVPSNGGDTITKTVDLTVDINTVYFRTGKGRTDYIDNFYYTVKSAVEPTATPSPTPTATPSPTPTATPSPTPTATPSPTPTATPSPTPTPTATPCTSPTANPSAIPTTEPTGQPTASPSAIPTTEPTGQPTASPSAIPTTGPTGQPTTEPTSDPDKIAAIGKYESSVEVEKKISGNEIVFTITPVDSDITEVMLFAAEYGSNGEMTGVKLIKGTLENGKISVGTGIPESGIYKLMLWDKNLLPIIKVTEK